MNITILSNNGHYYHTLEDLCCEPKHTILIKCASIS